MCLMCIPQAAVALAADSVADLVQAAASNISIGDAAAAAESARPAARDGVILASLAAATDLAAVHASSET